MVALPRTVNVEEEAGQGGKSVLIPQGKYPAIIVGSEMKPNKSGHMIVFKVIITQGQFKETEFSENLNIINPNAETVRIAYQTIANIGRAVGLATVTTTEEVQNKPLIIEVENEAPKDWVNDKGEAVKGKERSKIKGFYPMPAGGVPVVTAVINDEIDPTAPAAVNPFAL